ncbi:beta-amyrin 28-monooxygenase-like [Salvia hispanica]|uniref:beta-amyrin 28-monooxygenase-like n=1 Tax=Salvia hispanica TaxID=49212 RepID=UPI0020095B66|nr:beta-amyrin 28-monooxygenase-like [Salvia hispanica]
MDSIMFFTIATLLISTIFAMIRRSRNRNPNLPPGSLGWPLVGESLEFLRASVDGEPEEFVRRRVKRYDSQVFKSSLMGENMVFMCGAAGNKFLFSNESKAVTVWWPGSVRKLLGPCLATSTGEEARLARRMIALFLTPDAFSKLYIKTMETVCHQHIKTHWEGKDEVKVFPTIKRYTFGLACRLFMGLEDEEHIGKLALMFNIFLAGLISFPINFPGTRFWRGKLATHAIKDEVLKIVRARRSSSEQKLDLLNHLITTPDERGNYMTDSVIVNNILMLLFAGHDTTSVTITMTFKCLAARPDIYERVLKEHEGIGESLQWEDLQKMKYTWSVACEALRLTPPVIGGFREALVDIDYMGYHIPKGWKLFWSASNTHMDSGLFPSSADFDPSRFEESSGPAPFTFVPFGGGPRMCTGKEFARLELLLLMHNLVKRYRWKLVYPDEKISCDPMPTPLQGLPVRLQPHN